MAATIWQQGPETEKREKAIPQQTHWAITVCLRQQKSNSCQFSVPAFLLQRSLVLPPFSPGRWFLQYFPKSSCYTAGWRKREVLDQDWSLRRCVLQGKVFRFTLGHGGLLSLFPLTRPRSVQKTLRSASWISSRDSESLAGPSRPSTAVAGGGVSPRRCKMRSLQGRDDQGRNTHLGTRFGQWMSGRTAQPNTTDLSSPEAQQAVLIDAGLGQIFAGISTRGRKGREG